MAKSGVNLLSPMTVLQGCRSAVSLVIPLQLSAPRVFFHLLIDDLEQRQNNKQVTSKRVTIPGGVQKTCRCGTSGYGVVGMVVLS